MCVRSQFEIEDLYELIFAQRRNGHLCMLYNCFLDDSKDETQSEAYICAGFLGDVDNWSALKVLWRQCLHDNHIDYYKSWEWKMLDGQFSRFKSAKYPPPSGREEANKIRDELLGTAQCVKGVAGVGVCIPVEIYREVGARPEASFFGSANPYRRALEGVFNETMRIIEALVPGDHEVAFIHDEGPDWHDLEDYYHEYKDLNPRHAKKMKGFIPLDDKDHPPLQLADAIANEGVALAKRWLREGQRPIEQDVFNICKFSVWDKHISLSILKHILVARGYPVPDDLLHL